MSGWRVFSGWDAVALSKKSAGSACFWPATLPVLLLALNLSSLAGRNSDMVRSCRAVTSQ
jgi:hypothetical protein